MAVRPAAAARWEASQNSCVRRGLPGSLLCLVVLGALAGRAAAGSFYGSYSPPKCRAWNPSVRPLHLVAGKLGFYGAAGDASPAALARFRVPKALAWDVVSERLYVSDSGNHAVRAIDLRDSTRGGGGIVTVLGSLAESGTTPSFGTPSAPALEARLCEPSGLALDAEKAFLYVADEGNHAIRRLEFAANVTASPADGAVSTLAGRPGVPGDSGDEGPAAEATLRSPSGLALDAAAQRLYFSDSGNHRLRVVDLANGTISAIDVIGVPPFVNPTGLALDAVAQFLYVADAGTHVVLRVHLANGTAAPIAGIHGVPGGVGDAAETSHGDDGMASGALLKRPYGIALDPVAQRLYIADSANPAIRCVHLASGKITVTVYRPGYFGHGLSDDDQGPVGLALGPSFVPGLEVLYTVHANMDPPPWFTYGEYFHFDASSIPDLVPPGTPTPDLPGKRLPPSLRRMCVQWRDGVVVWIGSVRFWGVRTILIGQVAGRPCPDCTATGVREPPGVCVPAPCPGAENRWRVGDVIQVLGREPDFAPETALHTEEATQLLYMAEGNNQVVRVTNIAPPLEFLCSPRFDDAWMYTEGIPT